MAADEEEEAADLAADHKDPDDAKKAAQKDEENAAVQVKDAPKAAKDASHDRRKNSFGNADSA